MVCLILLKDGEYTIKYVLITGANKGIGLATAKVILEHSEDTAVVLGSRDSSRGQLAIETLCRQQPAWTERLMLLEIDVTCPRSIEKARDRVADTLGTESPPLYGLVNNAGIGLGSADMDTVLAVNTRGVKLVCDAFIPLLKPAGRVVIVSSASGPKFVSQCSAERQSFFQNPSIEWPELESLMCEVNDLDGDPSGFKALGLGEINAYGFSKACVSLYMLILSRENPELCINACTPGYIETDLTRPQADSQGISPSDMGMKPPEQGTVPILFLLFGEPQNKGCYYGSDARRSPLDRYRAPGSPEYKGEN